ncbi:MAG: transporter [Isosphaeraceae bacterium]
MLGSGGFQVYALQLRLALTERLQLFADKDGIVRVSPNPGKSVTGLANIAAGAKYVFIRDEENQFLFSGAVQYEAPTGYANIYQNQGSGLLGVYGIFAKEFADSWHLSGQFGQNIAMQNQQNGYFYTHLHVDRRFGNFVPFFEANWFYYNQSAKYLPASVGMEGAGFLNLGTAGFTGNSIVTLAPGFKYDFGKHLELGVCYQFPVTDPHKSLYGNQAIAELIFRY